MEWLDPLRPVVLGSDLKKQIVRVSHQFAVASEKSSGISTVYDTVIVGQIQGDHSLGVEGLAIPYWSGFLRGYSQNSHFGWVDDRGETFTADTAKAGDCH